MGGLGWPRQCKVAAWLQVLWFSFYSDWQACAKEEDLPPLVIIPPLTGSVLYSEVDESSLANPLCGLQISNRVWPPATSQLLMGGLLDCWRQQMQVTIDAAATKRKRREVEQPVPGIRVHPAVGAQSTGQDSLEPGVWEPVLWHLHQLGFSFGKNMFVAPFDWRRGPSFWEENSWPQLKSKVESWVAASSAKKPAIFISMSLGCPYFVAFLQNHHGITPKWKQQHVAGFVSLSGVYSGTVSALSLLLWGRLWPGPVDATGKTMYDRHLSEEAQEVLSPLLHGWGSIAWLLPRPSPVRSKQQPIVELPVDFRGNVTVSQLPTLLAHVAPTAEALLLAGSRFSTSAHPGVKVHCLFGTGKQTPVRFSYRGGAVRKEVADAKTRATVAARLAAEKLKKRGVNLGDDQMQARAVGLVSEVADLLAPSTTPVSREGPSEMLPPSRSAGVGSEAWLTSTSETLKQWMPSETIPGPGDGLVEHESLAMCEKWKGQSGLPDADIVPLPGSGHGEESHNAEALLKIRAAIASLAGANISRTRAGAPVEYCSDVIAKCPKVRNSDHCSNLAVRRQLGPAHDCCKDAAVMSQCLHLHCFAELLGGFIAADPAAQGVIKAWRRSCTNVQFPSWRSIHRFVRDARSMWQPKAPPENVCVTKLPGQGCPALPMLKQCEAEARAGLLRPQHPCCRSLVRSLDCMGTRCFTDFVSVGLTAAETLGGQPSRGVLLALRSGCQELRLPVEAILVSANKTHAAVDRLLPAGVAAASQVWNGLMGSTKDEEDADGEDVDNEESKDIGKESPDAARMDGEDDRAASGTPHPQAEGGGFALWGLAIVLQIIVALGVCFAVRRHRRTCQDAARGALLKEVAGEGLSMSMTMQADAAVAPARHAPSGEEAYLAMQDP